MTTENTAEHWIVLRRDVVPVPLVEVWVGDDGAIASVLLDETRPVTAEGVLSDDILDPWTNTRVKRMDGRAYLEALRDNIEQGRLSYYDIVPKDAYLDMVSKDVGREPGPTDLPLGR